MIQPNEITSLNVLTHYVTEQLYERVTPNLLKVVRLDLTLARTYTKFGKTSLPRWEGYLSTYSIQALPQSALTHLACKVMTITGPRQFSRGDVYTTPGCMPKGCTETAALYTWQDQEVVQNAWPVRVYIADIPSMQAVQFFDTTVEIPKSHRCTWCSHLKTFIYYNPVEQHYYTVDPHTQQTQTYGRPLPDAI